MKMDAQRAKERLNVKIGQVSSSDPDRTCGEERESIRYDIVSRIFRIS